MKGTTYNNAIKKINKKLKWTTALGDEILIADMEKTHIQNTIIMLHKRQELCNELELGNFEVNELTANEWMEIFREELKLRK